jgi:hypothetical protein
MLVAIVAGCWTTLCALQMTKDKFPVFCIRFSECVIRGVQQQATSICKITTPIETIIAISTKLY